MCVGGGGDSLSEVLTSYNVDVLKMEGNRSVVKECQRMLRHDRVSTNMTLELSWWLSRVDDSEPQDSAAQLLLPRITSP